MSSAPNSHCVGSGHSGHYIVSPQTIHSAISTHQWQQSSDRHCPSFVQTLGVARSNELVECRNEMQTALDAFINGQISRAEFDVVLKRIGDAGRDYDRRVADYDARKQAGQAKPSDWFKEFHGLTDEEAKQHLHQGGSLMDIRTANEERSSSRMAQQSRHGRGY